MRRYFTLLILICCIFFSMLASANSNNEYGLEKYIEREWQIAQKGWHIFGNASSYLSPSLILNMDKEKDESNPVDEQLEILTIWDFLTYGIVIFFAIFSILLIIKSGNAMFLIKFKRRIKE